MQLSEKIWIKIQESFNFKKIKDKMPKNQKKKPLPEYQVDLNVDQKEIVLWSAQNDEIIKQIQILGFTSDIINKPYLQQVYKELLLDDQNIINIDRGIFDFSNLTCLSLNSNNIVKIENIPSQLLELHLHQNQIINIDKSMKADSLQYLGIGMNKLQDHNIEKISEIFPNLISLDISHNNICYVNKCCDTFQNLKKIKIINLFGNPLCLSYNYPHMIIKDLKNLKYFDNNQIDHLLNQRLVEQLGQQNNILTLNSTLENSVTLQLDIQSLENINGFYFEDLKFYSSYWIQTELFNKKEINTINEKIGLDKADIINEDKFIIDFKQQLIQQIAINQENLNTFLEKFIIKVFVKELQVTINQETGEKTPSLDSNQEPIYETKLLGATILDLSEWILNPKSQKVFQKKLHLYPESVLKKYQFYFPLENESKQANALYEKEIEQQTVQQQVNDINKDKSGKKNNKPAKKEDKKVTKGGKDAAQDLAKVSVTQYDYQQSQRVAILIDDNTIIRSIGPLLAIQVKITQN